MSEPLLSQLTIECALSALRVMHDSLNEPSAHYSVEVQRAHQVEILTAIRELTMLQQAQPAAADAHQWEREFPPEWDRHPWANYACLIVAFGHFDGVTLRWEYYEKEPKWGEKSYNWVAGLHGFENPVTRAPLSLFFDTRATLRQRPASGQKAGGGSV